MRFEKRIEPIQPLYARLNAKEFPYIFGKCYF